MPSQSDHDDPTHTLARDPASALETHGVRLSSVAGPHAGTSVDVAQRLVVIGRSKGADFRLNDPMVSAFHAEISVTEGGFRVRDLNSRNGTFHSGVRLESAVIPPGTTLEVGGSLVRVDATARFALEAHDAASFGGLRGESASMRELFHLLTRLARTDLSVLVEGPTGTGKELTARGIHASSPYANGPFVVLDCGAIPSGLAESMLFGHERGAFTGATDARAGVFEAAEGGTIFLDEIGELPMDLQSRLLRVLERREVQRVGSTRVRPVRVRVVSATWRDLRAMINQGRFREDLFYRLAQARVTIPPLRERPEDVPMLVEHFLGERPVDAPGARAIAPDALSLLCRGEYPGNVRELRSIVERAAALAEGSVITTADLAFERILAGEGRRAPLASIPPPAAPISIAPPAPVEEGTEGESLEPYKQAKQTVVDGFERDYLLRLLSRAGNNLSRAAALAGLERHSLRYLFRKHRLRTNEG